MHQEGSEMNFRSIIASQAGQEIAEKGWPFEDGAEYMIHLPINPILSPFALNLFLALRQVISGFGVRCLQLANEAEPDTAIEYDSSRVPWNHMRVRFLLMGQYALLEGNYAEPSRLFERLLKEHAGEWLSEPSTKALRHFVSYKAACFGTIANDLITSLEIDANARLEHMNLEKPENGHKSGASGSVRLVPLDIVRRLHFEDITQNHEGQIRDLEEGMWLCGGKERLEQLASLILKTAAARNGAAKSILEFFDTPDSHGITLLCRILDVVITAGQNIQQPVYWLCDKWISEAVSEALGVDPLGEEHGFDPDDKTEVIVVAPDNDPKLPGSIPLPLFVTPSSGRIVRAQFSEEGVGHDDRLMLCSDILSIMEALRSSRLDLGDYKSWRAFYENSKSDFVNADAELKRKKNLLENLRKQDRKPVLGVRKNVARSEKEVEKLTKLCAELQQQVDDDLAAYETSVVSPIIEGLLKLDQRTVAELRYVL